MMVVLLLSFLLVRLLQRLYYLVRGHSQLFSFRPRVELEAFLENHHIKVSEHAFKIEDSGLMLRYRRLGTGQKFLVLANGVGTDFFMWLPFLRQILTRNKDFFEEFTFIVPSYRGLFEPDDSLFKARIDITIENCALDLLALMKHAKIPQFHTIMGWSTGAQVAMHCCSFRPEVTQKLVLVNPSTGLTLHTALQAVLPWPRPMGRMVSFIVNSGIQALKPLIGMGLWDYLKIIAYSPVFRGILECSSFFGGFPPEQGAYFHEYLRDVFKTRTQTRSLLDLILSLDVPPLPGADKLPHETLLVSGYLDFITGVYHSSRLSRTLPRCKDHLCFTMGSHFILLEWPDLVAQGVLKFISE